MVIGSSGRRRQSTDRSPVSIRMTTAVRVVRSGRRSSASSLFELAHDELVDEPRQCLLGAGDLAAVVGRVPRQARRPVVQAHVVEEHLQVAQQPAAAHRQDRQGMHVRPVVLQDRA